MIHSVLKVRSASSAKASLPSMVMPFRAGGLTSSSTVWPLAIVTLPPACGTAPPDQVDESDQLPLLTASWAVTPEVKLRAASAERMSVRLLNRMETDPLIIVIIRQRAPEDT